jgi:hypothetical protein
MARAGWCRDEHPEQYERSKGDCSVQPRNCMNVQYNVGSRKVLETPTDPLTTIRLQERKMAAAKHTKRPDLSNRKFGRLTVIRQSAPLLTPSGYTKKRWACACECGGLAVVQTGKLLSGYTKSCGCLRAINRPPVPKRPFGLPSPRRIRGEASKKVFDAWRAMVARCDLPHHPKYQDYGGRGIRVCEAWRDFLTFYRDMGEPSSPNLSLDRINNDAGYGPGNCRWATASEQALNRRKRGSRDVL